MKISVLLLVVLFNLRFAAAQDSTSYYIKKLGWESIVLKTTYVSELILGKDGQWLVASKNDKTVKKLFCVITDDTRTAVVHMILSKMYEPQNSSFKESYVYKNDSIITVNLTYNNFTWQYHTKEAKYTIAPEEVKKIKEYWAKKLPVLQKMSSSAKRKQSKKCNKEAVSKGAASFHIM